MTTIHPSVCLFYLLFLSITANVLEAADKSVALLLVKDALTFPNHATTVEARLVDRSVGAVLSDAGLGGELLELVIDGKVIATAMTGGDGKALLSYTPKAKGLIRLQVRVGASPRVVSTDGEANLAVWERRQPILMVEMTSLMEEPASRGPLSGIGLKIGPQEKPLPDAAAELIKLTKFYYRVIYVVWLPTSHTNGFRENVAARAWLRAHKFPSGYVLVIPPGEDVLGAKIDEFHADGRTTVKIGIGRSQPFADAFLKRRLEAVIVPEPTKGEAPRKAKVAKGWKEVRKKL